MLRRVDCVMFRVDDVDQAVASYRDVLGLKPLWREGDMAGLDFPETPGTQIVLHNNPNIPKVDVNYKVDGLTTEVERLKAAGCRVVAGPFPIAIGNCAVILDPFGNPLTLVDMTAGPRTDNLET